MFLDTPDYREIIQKPHHQAHKVKIYGKEYTQFELERYAGAYLKKDFYNVPKRLMKYFMQIDCNFKPNQELDYIRKYEYCLYMNELDKKAYWEFKAAREQEHKELLEAKRIERSKTKEQKQKEKKEKEEEENFIVSKSELFHQSAVDKNINISDIYVKIVAERKKMTELEIKKADDYMLERYKTRLLDNLTEKEKSEFLNWIYKQKRRGLK